MYQTFDFRAVFALDWYNKSSVTLGNQRFLQIFALGRGFDQLIQPFPHPQLCLIDLSSQACQFGAGAVRQLFLRQNRSCLSVFSSSLFGVSTSNRGSSEVFSPSQRFLQSLTERMLCSTDETSISSRQRKVGTFFCLAQCHLAVLQLM